MVCLPDSFIWVRLFFCWLGKDFTTNYRRLWPRITLIDANKNILSTDCSDLHRLLFAWDCCPQIAQICTDFCCLLTQNTKYFSFKVVIYFYKNLRILSYYLQFATLLCKKECSISVAIAFFNGDGLVNVNWTFESTVGKQTLIASALKIDGCLY